MRRTKVVCTIGPASESEAMLRALIQSGMNVARLNMSHGNYEDHGRNIALIRQLRAEMGIPLAVMLDTQGPEVRTGRFGSGPITLTDGQEFILTTRDVKGDTSCVSVNHAGLPGDLSAGARVLIDDGLIELRVTDIVDGTDIRCLVVNGGDLSFNKGVNVPGVELSLPSVTPKDVADIEFGLSLNVDIVAASFVRGAEDIAAIRTLLAEHGETETQIFAKIETAQSVEAIDDIISAADGIMVARGDLGVELPIEDLPATQKSIIRKCNAAGLPVITATQMLDSMIRNPRPTRAEVTDIANSILDGTDGIMLSGETATGKYPLEALRMMNRIAQQTESDSQYHHQLTEIKQCDFSITNAVSYACHTIARELNAAAIITPTHQGNTAVRVSRFRPRCQLIATTTSIRAYHQLAAVWGVTSILVEPQHRTSAVIDNAIDHAKEQGLLTDGQVVVVSGGVPVGISGTTNMIRVQVVGEPGVI